MTASAVLAAAAERVAGWPMPYAEPLAELLRAEAEHAHRLESEAAGWDRYPPGALLVRLADGILAPPARERLLLLDPPMCEHGCCPDAVCAWAEDCASHRPAVKS